jgi:hypothetical protein
MRMNRPFSLISGRILGESFDIAAEHPDIVKKIQAAVAEHQRAMVPGKPQL